MSYGNPARRRFPKSHIFEFKVGVGRSLAVMGAEVCRRRRIPLARGGRRSALGGQARKCCPRGRASLSPPPPPPPGTW